MNSIHVYNMDDGVILSEHESISQVEEAVNNGSLPGIVLGKKYLICEVKKIFTTKIETVDLTEELLNKTHAKATRTRAKKVVEETKPEAIVVDPTPIVEPKPVREEPTPEVEAQPTDQNVEEAYYDSNVDSSDVVDLGD